jgi:hypothetical protein
VTKVDFKAKRLVRDIADMDLSPWLKKSPGTHECCGSTPKI